MWLHKAAYSNELRLPVCKLTDYVQQLYTLQNLLIAAVEGCTYAFFSYPSISDMMK